MRALWGVINQILNKRKNYSLPNEFQVDGSLTKDPVAIALIFFFAEIGPTLTSKIPAVNESLLRFMKSPTAGFHFSPITSNEVCQILGSLKNSAPGFDNVN